MNREQKMIRNGCLVLIIIATIIGFAIYGTCKFISNLIV